MKNMINKKTMILLISLFVLVIGLSAVSAEDVAGDTDVADTPVVETVSDVDESIVDESVDDVSEVDKKIIDSDKLSAGVVTRDVSNYAELTNAINEAKTDNENDEYVININGNISLANTVSWDVNNKIITMNGNNNTIANQNSFDFLQVNSGNFKLNNLNIRSRYLRNFDILTINNCVIINTTTSPAILNYANLTIKNTTINYTIENYGDVIFDDDVLFIDNTQLKGSGNYTISDMGKIMPYLGTYNSTLTIENFIISSEKYNYGNLTFKNCTLNASLTNYGNIFFDDDVIFGSNFAYNPYENGSYIINDESKMVPYYNRYNGTYTVNNIIISQHKYNYGNLTFNNCSCINKPEIDNYGTIIFNNCNINGFNNYDNSTAIFNNCIINNSTWSLNNKGNLTLNNSSITHAILNYANLTIANTTLTNTTNNNANSNLTIINSTINSTIGNNGIVIIADDVTFGENCLLTGNGNYVINDTARITPYFLVYNGTYTIENVTVSSDKTNNGNLTYKNCTINSTITNNGNIIFADDVVFGEGCVLDGTGTYVINDTNKIVPYLTAFNGTYLIENLTIASSKTNYGNLTLNNTIVNAQLTNRGNLTLNNTIVNARLSNNAGNLILLDNVTFGTNFRLIGTGKVLTNNSEVKEYFKNLGRYVGDNTIENTVVNQSITNLGELTIKNSTLNSTITNRGVLIIDDDVVFGENFALSGTGSFVINDITRLLPYTSTINGTHTISNVEFNKSYTFGGDITLNNCSITYNNNYNYGILVLNNCTINCTGYWMFNYDTIVINNYTNIISGNMSSSGTVLYGERPVEFYPIPSTFTGENTVENKTFTVPSTNNGNLTITDSTILATITNNGNITFKNTTINATINNYGIVTFDDDVVFGENFAIGANYGNLTIINVTFSQPISNNGNLTLINCTFRDIILSGAFRTVYAVILNNGNLTVINCTFDNITVTTSSQYFTSSAIYNNASAILNGTVFENININYTGTSSDRSSPRAVISSKPMLVDNCQFINNCQSVYGSNLIITNCLFENNSEGAIGASNTTVKNSTFRNNIRIHNDTILPPSGGALNGSNLTVMNCTFENNGIEIINSLSNGDCGGGAISADGNSIITDCIFKDNGISSSSTWGAATGGAIFASGNLTVSNCEFINNSISAPPGVVILEFDIDFHTNGMGGVISAGRSNMIINNTFDGAYAEQGAGAILITGLFTNTTIANNTFKNIQSINETMLFELNESFESSIDISNNTYTNCSIEFDEFTISAPTKIYPNTTIEIMGNSTLSNPDFYDENLYDTITYDWYVGDKYYTTTNTLNLDIFKNDTSNMIIYAVHSINTEKSTNVLVLKTNTLSNVLITPENINSYVYRGDLIGIDEDTNITFQGEFNNIGPINIDTNYISLNGVDATFTNSTFIIDSDNVNMYNMNIDNTDTSKYAIESTGNNNQFINNTIKVNNTNGLTAAISAQGGDNNTIDGNTITVYGPSIATIGSNNGIISNTQGILVKESTNVKVTNNKVTVSNSTDADADLYSTIEAITVSENIENALISYNNVTVTGARFIYGIDSLNIVNNETINYNNINVAGHRYTDGIQVGNDATNIIIEYNNITTECHNETVFDDDNEAISYGIITSNMGGGVSENITIKDNNIKQNSTINYGMEIYQTQNTNITGNNITGDGAFSMGIGFAHSPNSIVNDNNMILTGDSDADVNYIVEELRPANTGVQIQQDSNNINIENNTIKTHDKAKKDSAVTTDATHTTVTNNAFTTSTTSGNDAVTTTKTDTKIANNTKALINVEVAISDVTANVLDEVTLNVTVINELGDAFTGGRVSFKVNGNYLKDASGEYVRANVINGTATATVTIAKQYIGENTLVAYFTGNSKYDKALSDEASLTVGKQDVTITIDPVEATVTESMTITAHITDSNGNAVSGGRVSFKVNGNYLKDENGNYIYANVKDGMVSINTTALNRWVGDNSTIQVCFGGNNYYNAAKSDETTMTINKMDVSVTIAPITATKGSTAQFTAFVMTDNGKLISNGRVGFKVNGITLRNADSSAVYANVAGGVAVATVDVLDRWNAENTIQAVYGGTSIYNTARSTLSTMSITE